MHPMRPPVAFAIPGDIRTRTGGYIYERRMLESLSEIGQPVRHVPLLPSFPHPTAEAAADAARKLAALPPGMPLILDGLVFGSIDTAVLASLDRRVIAMLHHPVGLEAGLPPGRAAELIERERANLRHAAHVVVTSAHTRDILVERFDVPAERISVALPGFDRPPRPAAAMARAVPPLILSVGIICERKGHDVLLRALGRIAGLNWQAVIVGMTHDEGVRRSIRDLRDGLGLAGRVRLAGAVPDAALDRLYREAHLFALATRYEGYGMALSEAQLYGLPVVSCAVGAVPKTVPDGTGLLAPPDDVPAFAAALKTVLTDPEMYETLARGSAATGRALPRWHDAARVMRDALDAGRALGPWS